MLGKLGYLLKEGVRNIWKNSFMTFASVGILMACLLLMGTFVLVSENINYMIEGLADDNEIALFIEDSVSREDALAMQEDIEAIDNVATVTFLSKEDAWEQWLEKQDNAEAYSEAIESSPLRDEYIITLNDISQMYATVEQLNQLPGVGDIRYREDVAQNLVKLKNMVGIVALVFLIVLVSISVFIISNTIKLGMFARRKEISIMKYVGATNAFIRLPFFVEGIIIGAVGGGLAYALQWYIYTYLVEKVVVGIDLINLVDFQVYAQPLLLAFMGAGLLVGLVSSIVSIRKYLNV
ncbi:MAG: permease-like cell division protein FtsX [Eubacteriales bacterium]|jgi:cell division transport system permease protein